MQAVQDVRNSRASDSSFSGYTRLLRGEAQSAKLDFIALRSGLSFWGNRRTRVGVVTP